MPIQQTPHNSLPKKTVMIAVLLISLVFVLTLTHITGIYRIIDHLITWRLSTHLQEFSLDKLRYQKGILHIEGLHIPHKGAAVSFKDGHTWDHDIFIQSVIIPCHYADLWAGRFHKIEVRGLSLLVQVAADASVSLGQLDEILADINTNLITFDTLDIQDSTIDLVSHLGDKAINFTMALQAEQATGLLSGDFTTGGFIEAKGSFHKDPQTIKIVLDSQKVSPLKRPLHIAITASGDRRNLELTLLLQDLQDKKDILNATGSLQPSSTTGTLTIEGRAHPLSRFVDISPLLTQWYSSLTSIDGNITVKGTLTWTGEWASARGPLSIECTQGNLVFSQGQIHNFAGTLQLAHLNPFVTPRPQEIRAEKVTFNSLPLTQAKLAFAFSPQGNFIPITFTAQTLGGEIKAHSFRPLKDLRNGPFCEMHFNNIQLEDLITLMAFNDLKISGTIQGRASIRLENAAFQLQDAEFQSSTPQGHLRYLSPTLPPKDSSELQGDQLAFKVLRDLHFTQFEGKIYHDIQAAGEFKAEIKLAGFNPEVLQGYPFEFNLTATGALKELIQNTLGNLQSPMDHKEISRLFVKSTHKNS
jgi:hypothetical protein